VCEYGTAGVSRESELVEAQKEPARATVLTRSNFQSRPWGLRVGKSYSSWLFIYLRKQIAQWKILIN